MHPDLPPPALSSGPYEGQEQRTADYLEWLRQHDARLRDRPTPPTPVTMNEVRLGRNRLYLSA